MDERPLHVRVAEALGWTNVHPPLEGGDHSCGDIMLVDPERMRWKGREPGELLVGREGCNLIPRYDTDWSATGPLIERYDFEVSRAWNTGAMMASRRAESPFDAVKGYGVTRLAAVCDLILATAAKDTAAK